MPPWGRPSIPQQSASFFAERLRTPQIIRVKGDVTSTTVRVDGGTPVDMTLTLTPSATWANAPFVASENLVIGLVNLWSDGGAFHVRKADQSLGQEASGFVLSAYTTGQTATVYFVGIAAGFSALTPGKVFLANAGLVSNTPGTTWDQEVGYAASASTLVFLPKVGIQL